MKENGAPEKIYVRVRDGKAHSIWHDEWVNVNDIDYIRTDAFVEKVIKWLIDNIQNYTDNGIGEHSFVLVQDLKEDFKKYMEL